MRKIAVTSLWSGSHEFELRARIGARILNLIANLSKLGARKKSLKKYLAAAQKWVLFTQVPWILYVNNKPARQKYLWCSWIMNNGLCSRWYRFLYSLSIQYASHSLPSFHCTWYPSCHTIIGLWNRYLHRLKFIHTVQTWPCYIGLMFCTVCGAYHHKTTHLVHRLTANALLKTYLAASGPSPTLHTYFVEENEHLLAIPRRDFSWKEPVCK